MRAKLPNYEKYLVTKPNFEAVRGVRNRQSPTMTYLSNSLVPSANCYLEFGWIQGIPAPNPFEAEHVHGFDQIMLLIGGNPEAPPNSLIRFLSPAPQLT